MKEITRERNSVAGEAQPEAYEVKIDDRKDVVVEKRIGNTARG